MIKNKKRKEKRKTKQNGGDSKQENCERAQHFGEGFL